MKSELLLKLDGLLGSDNEELHIVRGQFIEGVQKKTNDERKADYYEFDLKVKKSYGESKYDEAYNYYHCVMPVEVSEKFSLEDMKSFKGNEVIAVLDFSTRIKKGEKSKFTSLQGVYCSDLGKLVTLDSKKHTEKVINL